MARKNYEKSEAFPDFKRDTDLVTPVAQYVYDFETSRLVEAQPERDPFTLRNTLFQALYPEFKLVQVTIPGIDRMPAPKRNALLARLQTFKIDGEPMKIVGSNGGIKKGTCYFVRPREQKEIALRYENIPENMMSYVGILISPMRVLDQVANGHVLVVKDGVLGTNDCRGWVSQSMYARLGIPAPFTGRPFQFRLAFGYGAQGCQAKGCFKIMDDETAAAIGADFILPQSSLKPFTKKMTRDANPRLTIDTFRFTGAVIWGYREVARQIVYNGNWSLTQFAPPEVLKQEIEPPTVEEVKKVIAMIEQGDVFALLDTISRGAEQEVDEDGNPVLESTTYEALLKADGSGLLARHPWVQSQLRRLMARWAYRMLTAGAYTMAGRLLMDDGILGLAPDGRIIAASDWIPKFRFMGDVSCQRGLLARYPIYNFSQLLPLKRVYLEHAVKVLHNKFHPVNASVTQGRLVELLVRQILLPGTIVVHSKTAKLQQGDFDGDGVAMLPYAEYPRFYVSRLLSKLPKAPEKDKTRKKSPLFQMEWVYMDAAGNETGHLTFLNARAIAADRMDLLPEINRFVQVSLDKIKFNVSNSRDEIRMVEAQIPESVAQWLQFKEAERVDDLPLDMPGQDGVSGLWRTIRPLLTDIFKPLLTPQFTGMVSGEEPSEAMYREIDEIYTNYTTRLSKMFEHSKQLKSHHTSLREQLKSIPKGTEPYHRHYEQIQAAKNRMERYEMAVNRSRFALEQQIYSWSVQKPPASRRAWAQACWVRSCRSQNTGSFVFKTSFLPELVDMITEATQGHRQFIEVADGLDGPVRVTPDGTIWVDVPGKEAPLLAYKLPKKYRFSETFNADIKDGRLILPGTIRPVMHVTIPLSGTFPDAPVRVSKTGEVHLQLGDASGTIIPFKINARFRTDFETVIDKNQLVLPWNIRPIMP